MKPVQREKIAQTEARATRTDFRLTFATRLAYSATVPRLMPPIVVNSFLLYSLNSTVHRFCSSLFSKRGIFMRAFAALIVCVASLVSVTATVNADDTAIPNLKGTWTGEYEAYFHTGRLRHG
jgi:hypothetical protein